MNLIKLGLLYQSTTRQTHLGTEPSGELDYESFFDKREKCWFEEQIISDYKKKVLIVTEKIAIDEHQDLILTFIELYNEGYEIFFPGPDCLVQLTNPVEITELMDNLTPANDNEKIFQLAAQSGLARDRILLITRQKIEQIFRKIYKLILLKEDSSNPNQSFSILQIVRKKSSEQERLAKSRLNFFASNSNFEEFTRLINESNHLKLLHISREQFLLDAQVQTTSLSLTQLEYLDLVSSPVSITALNLILNSTRKLFSLSICYNNDFCDDIQLEGDPDQLTLSPGQLNHLAHLKLNTTALSIPLIRSLFIAAPNLYYLDIWTQFDLGSIVTPDMFKRLGILNILTNEGQDLSRLFLATQRLGVFNCEGPIARYPTLTNGSWHRLQQMTLDRSPINEKQLEQLLEIAPGLKLLDTHFTPISDKRSSFQLPHSTTLKILTLRGHHLFLNHLVRVLEVTPELIELKLDYKKIIEDRSILKYGVLAKLKKLSLLIDMNSSKIIKMLLNASPAIEFLTFNNQALINTSKQVLKAGQLSFLDEIIVDASEIDLNLINEILTAAINLSRFEFIDIFGISEELVNQLKEQWPKISFFSTAPWGRQVYHTPQVTSLYSKSINTVYRLTNQLKNKFVSLKSYFPVNNSPQQPDGMLNNAPDIQFKTRRVFVGHGIETNTEHYHLYAYEWDQSKGAFYPRQVCIDKLQQVIPQYYPSPFELKNTFEINPNYSSCHHFYALFEWTNLEKDLFYQLPALTNHDELLAIAANNNQFTIWHEGETGYYYLRPDRLIQFLQVGFIIESLPVPAPSSSFSMPVTPLFDLISQLRFNREGLEFNDAFIQLKAYSHDELRIALSAFCFFPKASGEDIQGDSWDIFNHLIQYRVGVCRHRAQLFTVLAIKFGLNSIYIVNDCHAFSLVWDENNIHCIDLGGGDGHVEVIDQLPISLPKNTAPIMASKPKKKNYFKTWNSCPIEATNLQELGSELRYQHQKHTRHLLVMPTQQTIRLFFNELIQANEQRTFLSVSLDSINLRSILISNGQMNAVDSPLSLFLKEAQDNPGLQFIWFINWSNQKEEHIGLNAIIDDKDPHLGSLNISNNIRRVILCDIDSNRLMGEDFHSRFDAISNLTIYSNQEEIKPKEFLEAFNDEDILLETQTDWKSKLLGQIEINPCFNIRAGALFTVRENQILTIHNAPWDSEDFYWFIITLEASRRFFFNGSRHDLPKGSSLRFAQPILKFPNLELPLHPAEEEFPLNRSTARFLVEHYSIELDGGFKFQPGLLSLPSLRLIVTEEFSEIRWYLWIMAAIRQGCALELALAPDVKIPELLKILVRDQTQLAAAEPVQININREQSSIHEDFPDYQFIPITPETRFENLFFRIWRQGDVFFGAETDFLKAIRNQDPLILKGKFSTELVERLATLFTKPPRLRVNGQWIHVNSPLILASDAPLKLTKANSSPSRCHPCEGREPFLTWNDAESEIHPRQPENDNHYPTQPSDLLDYLQSHPFVFLISKSGSGKSHLVLHRLKDLAPNLIIYHGIKSILNWIKQINGLAILFIDEANLSKDDYLIFENLARGERIIWLNGMRYELSPGQKIIFAGNPNHYEGRFQAELFRRYPYFLNFKEEPLECILESLFHCFKTEPLQRIYELDNNYKKALSNGLAITARNAQMSCMMVSALKQITQLKNWPENQLLQYALLQQYNSLSAKSSSKELYYNLQKETTTLKKQIRTINFNLSSKDFVWTDSRKKIAFLMQTLLLIRQQKIEGIFNQTEGINGLLLEGLPGLGKSRFFHAIMTANHLDYLIINSQDPQEMRRQLIEAFHQGKIVLIDELNSFPDEILLNTLLSGYDDQGQPPKIPGFFIMATQNPISFAKRKPLSKALSNRFMIVNFKEYSREELDTILKVQFLLPESLRKKRLDDYFKSREKAYEYKLVPAPNPRNLFKRAKKDFVKHASEFLDNQRQHLLLINERLNNILEQLKNESIYQIVKRIPLSELLELLEIKHDSYSESRELLVEIYDYYSQGNHRHGFNFRFFEQLVEDWCSVVYAPRALEDRQYMIEQVVEKINWIGEELNVCQARFALSNLRLIE